LYIGSPNFHRVFFRGALPSFAGRSRSS
jgi:hypothetical protein